MIKTSATLKRCPKFDSHMQAHCGYVTAALGSGPLPCRPISSGRDRAALFFKALNAILDGHPPCQALGSASGWGGGGGRRFPIQEWQCRTDQRMPSARLFEPLYWASFVARNSGQLREEDHLREARVIHPNHRSNPPQLCFHDECLNA